MEEKDPAWLIQLLEEVAIATAQTAINDRIIFNY
jgi:hypothetical protein